MKAATNNKTLRTELFSEEKFPIRNKSIHLSLEIRENEAAAAILDKHENRYIAFCRFPFDANENGLPSILKDDFFASSFADVSVVFTSNSAILTPAAFYKKELLNDYLGLPKLTTNTQTPCSDYIKNLDSYNLYSVNTEWLSSVRNVLQNAIVRHHSSIFIEYTLIQNKGAADDTVHVTVFEKYVDIIVLRKGILTLYNRFYYESSNDFLYYLLWVYEQLQLDSRKDTCIFYGDVSEEKIEGAKKYLGSIILRTMSSTVAFSAALRHPLLNKYQTLFVQYLSI